MTNHPRRQRIERRDGTAHARPDRWRRLRGHPSPSEAGLPNYQPSTVVSESRGATVLRTSDPIDKVSAYYINLIDTGGWQAVSQTVTGHAANLVVKKSGQGASITISSNPAGPQTLIVISTYPTA
jgi:hypothetical protein